MASSTWTRVPVMGAPMGTGDSTCSGEAIGWQQVNVVFSVGP
ncbi:hypothetical protein COSO111634_26375 [Corallococcus soli]